MGNIVDVNALYNVGKSMGGSVRDNRQRDAFAKFIGGTALQFLGQAFQTRKTLRQQGNTTVSNSKLKLNEGDYNESMLDIATGVIDMGKKDLNKGANLSATGRGGKGTDLINKTNSDLKSLTSGLDFIKNKMDMWKDIYTNGDYTDKDGNVTKVGVNSASPAASQALAASFADGSIADHMDFRDGEWGLVGEQETDGIKTETFTNINDLELPELDESKIINDYSKTLNRNVEEQGYKNKTGDWSQYESDVRDNVFDDFQNMTENQISSKWFSKNGSDFSTPALNYLTQEGGYTIGGVQHDALLDPNAMDITAEEQTRRQDIATGELERLKLEDLDSYEKSTWLINNDIMPDARKAFERGFSQKPDTKTTSSGNDGLGGYLSGMQMYQQDWQVKGYMNDLSNGKVMRWKNNNGDQVEARPVDNGYMYNGEVISKNDLAGRMGLPEANYGGNFVASGGSSDVYDYDKDFGFDFITMNEEKAEEYLEKMLPEGFTYDQYGMGDGIKINFGDNMVKINLQPNTAGGQRANIKKVQDFIKEHVGGVTTSKNENVDMGDGNSNEKS